jgi:hemolysin III
MSLRDQNREVASVARMTTWTGGVRDNLDASDPSVPVRPKLRGWLHAVVAPLVTSGGIVLAWLAPAGRARDSVIVYAITGTLLFTTSAVYHRGTWRPTTSGILRRADHANVYLLIAGTYTPVATLGLPAPTDGRLLMIVWTATAVGVLFRFKWPGAPRALYTALYIGLGWSLLPVVNQLIHQAGGTVFVLVLIGGLCYSAGGAVYALKRPDPSPKWFGFHEVFHSLTVAGWASQYAAISILVYRLK